MERRIQDLDKVGFLSDLPNHEVPENGFTSVLNVKFDNGKVSKVKGWKQVFGTNPVVPYNALTFDNQSSLYWILLGQQKIYVTDMSGSYTNITRQTAGADVNYSATQDLNWTHGVLNGELPFFNNGVDSPQVWDGNVSNKCTNMKYNTSQTWNDLSYTCNSMRAFKNYLFALDVTKAGVRYPNLVKWSSSAVAGSEPDTWDESDTLYDAGETYLSDDAGFLIDSAPLKDTLMIYGEGTTYGCQYIGGRFVFRFYRLFNDGILSRRCIAPIRNNHLILSLNDLILHDGHTVNSIISNRDKSWLFNNIDQDNFQRSFLTPNYRENEIWVCFPSTGQTQANLALVWNYEKNTFSQREIPSCNHIGYGIVDPGDSLVIDNQSQIIDTDTSTYDQRTYNPTVYYPVACGTNFYQLDSTEQQAGTNMTAYAERLGLDFESNRHKSIKRIIPRMSGTGSVTFSLALQKNPNSAVTYKNYTFTPGSDYKIDVRGTNRLIGYRILSSSNITWELHSVDFEYTLAGDR